MPAPAPARPACVSRLRITGFKTFADPVALDLLPGLTGLVGPNGCGKSNVVDALRWAMGEGNARTLRGAGMDDVIFAGTAARPGLDAAEVALTLEGGSFPAPFAGLETVQVVRRIERGAGSSYRVNNRDVRARDVQAPFADLAGGARGCGVILEPATVCGLGECGAWIITSNFSDLVSVKNAFGARIGIVHTATNRIWPLIANAYHLCLTDGDAKQLKLFKSLPELQCRSMLGWTAPRHLVPRFGCQHPNLKDRPHEL